MKVNDSPYRQFWVTPNFSTGQDLLKKILRNINKINIDTINGEKLFDRPADHK